VGSIVFSIPFPVEDGVFDLAAYFLPIRIVGVPVFPALRWATSSRMGVRGRTVGPTSERENCRTRDRSGTV